MFGDDNFVIRIRDDPKPALFIELIELKTRCELKILSKVSSLESFPAKIGIMSSQTRSETYGFRMYGFAKAFVVMHSAIMMNKRYLIIETSLVNSIRHLI